MVYMIETVHPTDHTGDAWFKIGYTTKGPSNRKDQLQTGCPCLLWLALHREGTMQDESAIQEELAEWHYRGEWFLSTCESRKAACGLIMALDPDFQYSMTITIGSLELARYGKDFNDTRPAGDQLSLLGLSRLMSQRVTGGNHCFYAGPIEGWGPWREQGKAIAMHKEQR